MTHHEPKFPPLTAEQRAVWDEVRERLKLNEPMSIERTQEMLSVCYFLGRADERKTEG